MRQRLKNKENQAQREALEDHRKYVSESATLFFRKDPTYKPKHCDGRNKALLSKQCTKDHENAQFNASKVNPSYRDH